MDYIETAYSTTYTYDDFNRLTNATANAFSRSYSFDEWGNIKNFAGLTLNYQTNASGAPTTNRIDTDSQGYGYSYDSAGNMTTGMGQSFSYDGANRLKTASNGTSSYGYDSDGKRVKKTENGTTTYYVYSSKLGQPVMEVTASSVQRAYVYGGGKLVAMQATDGQFYWLHTNHLGNSRAMTDASGNLTYKGQFDPYGATLTEWSGSGNTNLNTKKFTGYERDSATGLDYANARMYNSARGRFMTPDPKGLSADHLRHPLSLNRYTYALGDPVNVVDPAGTSDVLAICVLVGEWGYEDADEQWHSVADQYSCSALGSGSPIKLPSTSEQSIGGGTGSRAPLNDSSVLRKQATDFFKEKPKCKEFVDAVAGAVGFTGVDATLSKITFVDVNVWGAPLAMKMSQLGFGSMFGSKTLSQVMVTDSDKPRALSNPFYGVVYLSRVDWRGEATVQRSSLIVQM